MPPPSFVYTTHAIETLVDRAIERDWVERTLLQPDVTEADPIHPDRNRAFREVPERGGRVLREVYVVEANTYRIITVFFDRGRRRRA